MQKIKIFFSLFLLVPILSWGHEDNSIFSFSPDEYCHETIKYKQWYEKNRKILDKRNVFFHKCILDHAKKGSSLDEETIMRSCYVISKDKYKTKSDRPAKFQHVITREFGSADICHKH